MTKEPASGNAPRMSADAPADWVRIPMYCTVEEQRKMLRDIAFRKAKDVTPKGGA